MTQDDTRERENIALLNSQALARLMEEHRLYISAADFPNWRPTQKSNGSIPGVASNVTIIATNGILAYFVFDDPCVPVLCGHIQCFTGDVKTLFASQKRKREEGGENRERKGRGKRLSQKEKTEKLLKELQGNLPAGAR